MKDQENRFRTVAFGGFHKQDVLNYIMSSSKDYTDQSTDMKKRAESAENERDELARKYDSAESARKKYAADCERLSETLTERTDALTQAELTLSELKAELEEKSARLAELEAHRKAQETVDQAQAQAAKIRGELEAWLRRVQNGYQHLRTDMTATVTHLSGELERGLQALNAAPETFRQYDEALVALMESEKISFGPKAPEPLPLDEVDCDG